MNHYPQFEVLRGLAALWVFFSHVLMISGIHVPLLSAGSEAVELFIILSGFVITLLVIKKSEPYKNYIFRRAVRLYPLFLIALLMGYFTSGLYEPVFGHNPWNSYNPQSFIERTTNESTYLWQNLVAHLTMLHGAVPNTLLPQAALAFSGPLWSISLEWQFYLIAPFVIWALDFRNRSIFFVLIIFSLIVVLRVLANRYFPPAEVPAFLPLRLELFSLGIFSGLAWEVARTSSWLKLLTTSIGIAFFYIHFINATSFPIILWFVVYSAAALGEQHRLTSIGNSLLKHPVLKWIGARSYGLYVLHMPIILILSNYLILPNAQVLNRFGACIALLFLGLPIVITLAAICYKYIETPTIEWGRNFSRNIGS